MREVKFSVLAFVVTLAGCVSQFDEKFPETQLHGVYFEEYGRFEFMSCSGDRYAVLNSEQIKFAAYEAADKKKSLHVGVEVIESGSLNRLDGYEAAIRILKIYSYDSKGGCDLLDSLS